VSACMNACCCGWLAGVIGSADILVTFLLGTDGAGDGGDGRGPGVPGAFRWVFPARRADLTLAPGRPLALKRAWRNQGDGADDLPVRRL
jgi:hypothetical protein